MSYNNYLKILNKPNFNDKNIFEAKKKDVKIFSVSAVFRPNQIYFKWYGSFFRKILKSFDFFYLQTKESKELLNKFGFTNVSKKKS